MEEIDKSKIAKAVGKLEIAFALANKDNEEVAKLLMQAIMLLTGAAGIIVEESISKKSENFAEEHREFLEDLGSKITKRGLHHLIFAGDPDGANSIVCGHMREDNLIKTIAGAMMQSKSVLEGVLLKIGVSVETLAILEKAKGKTIVIEEVRNAKLTGDN